MITVTKEGERVLKGASEAAWRASEGAGRASEGGERASRQLRGLQRYLGGPLRPHGASWAIVIKMVMSTFSKSLTKATTMIAIICQPHQNL